MKKKIVSLLLVIALLATAVIGGTLAYFTDTDDATNSFAVGGVKIALHEENTEGDKDDAYQKWLNEQVLMPGDNKTNTIDKIVTVENTGKSDAYVRVHVAIPSALVDQNYNSYNDMLHMNFTGASVAAGLWCWLPEYAEGTGWTGNGATVNNVYKTTINGEEYNVWVITYRSVLAAGATTEHPAITQVYLDKYVDMDATHNNYVKPFFTDKQGGTVDTTQSFTWPVDQNIDVLVFAEGVQAEGFANAYEAFAAAYPAIGTYDPWNNN